MIDLKTFINLFHLLGLTMGLGATIVLDFYLLKQFLGGNINKAAIELTHWLSRFVVAGFVILIASGLGFCLYYYLRAPNLLENPKLQAKFTIILILAVNSFFLHAKVLPVFSACVGRNIFESTSAREKILLISCAAISFTGWWWAFTLGAVRELNFSKPYYVFIAGFLLNVFIALLIAVIAHKKFSSHFERRMSLKQSGFPFTTTT
jgi:uncharacterized membrane protein